MRHGKQSHTTGGSLIIFNASELKINTRRKWPKKKPDLMKCNTISSCYALILHMSYTLTWQARDYHVASYMNHCLALRLGFLLTIVCWIVGKTICTESKMVQCIPVSSCFRSYPHAHRYFILFFSFSTLFCFLFCFFNHFFFKNDFKKSFF